MIVVAYESGETLFDCVASVEPLIAAGHELWLVDNASSDGAVERVASRYPFCQVIRLERNIGFGPANNVAALRARGDRFLLLNPDAWLLDDCAERLSSALDADPRLGQVGPASQLPDDRPRLGGGPTLGVVGEAIQQARRRVRPRWVGQSLMRIAFLLGDPGWLSGACFLARREAWESVGGFDERFFLYFEDADLSVRLREAGWRVGRCADARVHHEGALVGSQERHYRRSQLLYYRLHRPAWENRFLLWWLRRKFRAVEDPALRDDLLRIADEAEAQLR